MDRKTIARAQFLTWLKDKNPDLFYRVVNRADSGGDADNMADLPPVDFGFRGMGATDDNGTTWWQRIAEGVTSLGTAVIGFKAQQSVLEANLDRAERGLPPIEMDAAAPVVKTQVALDPEIIQRLQESATAGMSNILLFGGLALGAFLLLKK